MIRRARAKSAPNSTIALLSAAHEYSQRGWSIIPIRRKKSVGLWKPFQKTAADHDTLLRQFAKEGIDGLAVITGGVSKGLAVRDFDVETAYHEWAETHPDDAARCPTVETARGYHVYGLLAQEHFADLANGELRADSGHYVVLPPSLHPSGHIYRWRNPLPPIGTPLPPLPSSLTQVSPKQNQAIQADPANPLHVSQGGQLQSLINRTLPTGPGQRNRQVFHLARGLLGLLGRDVDHQELRRIVIDWHRQALPYICTKPFDETWTDFVTAWGRIERPAGASLAAAIAALDAESVPEAAKQYDTPQLRKLVGLCRQLATLWGDKPFPLGCEVAGESIGVSKSHAHRLLKTLQFDGIIKLAKKGSKASRQASEWHYQGSSNDCA